MGFVHWVGTFGSLSKRVNNLRDLTDGIALFEICAEIDRQWFKSIRSADIGDNWVLKMNNLKKLYKLVTQYYEEVLGYPASNLAEPNLAAIAKNEEPDELLKLCHLILTLAVQCERNQVYIGKIMSLGEDDQRSLMVSIESVLAQLGSGEGDGSGDGQDMDMDDDKVQSSDGGDPVGRLQAELLKSYAEKDELEKSALELSSEHRQVQNKYEELLVLNEELKMRMDDLEKSMARADKTGRADFLLRAEIEKLKHELEKAEVRNQENERQLKEQTATIGELSRKVSEAGAAKEEARRLGDQLQEYKHAAERLAKSEHVIEKYKKKLEESTDLRRQLRQAEEQLVQAQDRSRQVEEEFLRVSQRRPAMDSYRDEYAQLEARHRHTAGELAQAMERVRGLEEEREREHQGKQRDQELILSLEESVRELELRGGAAGGGRQQQADSTGFLEEVADAANREKEEALRRLGGSEAAAASLREEKRSLEGWYAETHEQSKELRAEVKELRAEVKELRAEAARLAAENRELRAGESREEGVARQSYSAADIDRLQKELVKSRDEVHGLQVGLKRTKDHCIQLDQRLKQQQPPAAQGGGGAQDSYKEVVASLQMQLGMKDEQLEGLSAMLREQNSVHLLESRTMASAWFNLQRQLERQSGFGHSSGMGSAAGASARQGGGSIGGGAPASWLGQQRVTLDMQLGGER
ncbi:hypothetical protein GGI04_002727 [Coemansia thaxteri]|nr:hypothetical protein GGI04_002727 [Coemansia thaxteri]KAJ2486008.1 hypothetical protein EV174_001383 [Coemansia sp. RSA 2320]